MLNKRKALVVIDIAIIILGAETIKYYNIQSRSISK